MHVFAERLAHAPSLPAEAIGPEILAHTLEYIAPDPGGDDRETEMFMLIRNSDGGVGIQLVCEYDGSTAIRDFTAAQTDFFIAQLQAVRAGELQVIA